MQSRNGKMLQLFRRHLLQELKEKVCEYNVLQLTHATGGGELIKEIVIIVRQLQNSGYKIEVDFNRYGKMIIRG